MAEMSKASPNHLESLPAELLVMIMENMPKMATLLDFLEAWPHAQKVFSASAKHVLLSVLTHDVPPEIKLTIRCIKSIRSLGVSTTKAIGWEELQECSFRLHSELVLLHEGLSCSMKGIGDPIAELRGIVRCWREVGGNGRSAWRALGFECEHDKRWDYKYAGAKGNLACSEWFRAMKGLLGFVPEAESVVECECADFRVHEAHNLACSLDGAVA